MAKSYERLIRNLCKLIRFDEPERVLKQEPLYLDDVLFILIHDTDTDPNRIFLFAEFGHLPPDRAIPAMEALLQENHAGFDGHGSAFAISPTTGHVLYSLHLALTKTTPTNLAVRMAYLMKLAKEWRRTYFLDQPGTEPAPQSARAARRRHFVRPAS
jgi:hypothetical protein